MSYKPNIRYFLIRLVIGLGLSTFFFSKAYEYLTGTREKLKSSIVNVAEVLSVSDNVNFDEDKDDNRYIVTFDYWDEHNKNRVFKIKTSMLYSQGEKYKIFYPPKTYHNVRLIDYWSLFKGFIISLIIGLEILLIYFAVEHYLSFKPQK